MKNHIKNQHVYYIENKTAYENFSFFLCVFNIMSFHLNFCDYIYPQTHNTNAHHFIL